MMYYTYMLRCSDNSIYTGITTDIERRMKEHFAGEGAAAKYTRSRAALKLERAWSSADRSLASKLEYAIKTLAKSKKEGIIKDPHKLFEYLGDKLDCNVYKIVV